MKAKPLVKISDIQCRMARAGLGWSASDLADFAGIDRKTVVRLETGKAKPTDANLRLIRETLEAAGVEFLDENGLRIHRSQNGEA